MRLMAISRTVSLIYDLKVKPLFLTIAAGVAAYSTISPQSIPK
jgi:hypothetical protein